MEFAILAVTVEEVTVVIEVTVVVIEVALMVEVAEVAVALLEEELAHEPSREFSRQAGKLGFSSTTNLGFEFGALVLFVPDPLGGVPTSTTVLMLAADEDSEFVALFE